MSSFKWHRENISLEEYKEKINLLASGDANDKLKKAYETASRIREFEIELFWKRATFFWAFIVAIYTAYYSVLTKIYVTGDENNPEFQHGKIPLLVLSVLGLFFCLSWLLSSIGSKHWQENWENHLDLLEDEITGPLYKTYLAGKAYSESKITIAAGWVVTVCAYGLVLYEFANMLVMKIGKWLFAFISTVSFASLVVVCMYGYSVLVIGNTKNNGDFEFQTKVYDNL